jgi:sucrose-6F-phosphate phosphohydrolase
MSDPRPDIERLLLCSDLDRTLIPNGPQPESPGARERFARFAADDRVQTAYVSGRDATLVKDAIRAHALPVPDFVIGDVGTTIYATSQDGDWQTVDAWSEHIAVDWRGRSANELRDAINGIDVLTLQEAHKQNRFKLSYYVDLAAEPDVVIEQVTALLEPLGVTSRLTYSIDEQEDTGLLDVLPQRSGKLQAIEFLIRDRGYGLEHTVFAGDSGNDLDVLCSRIAAVLVANASSDVRDAAVKQSAENGFADRLYLARGGFCEMNGNYAAGVLEGVAHYHPSVRDWLSTDEVSV